MSDLDPTDRERALFDRLRKGGSMKIHKGTAVGPTTAAAASEILERQIERIAKEEDKWRRRLSDQQRRQVAHNRRVRMAQARSAQQLRTHIAAPLPGETEADTRRARNVRKRQRRNRRGLR